jgi:hypothetical protein
LHADGVQMTCLIRCANKLTKYLVPPNGWRGERVGEHLRKLRALLLGRAAAAEEKGKAPVAGKAAAEEKGKAPVPKKAAAAINKPSGGAHDGASSEAAERAAASERSLALLAIDALEATLACATALGVPASLIHIEPRLTLPLEEWPSGMHLQVRALMALMSSDCIHHQGVRRPPPAAFPPWEGSAPPPRGPDGL